MICSECKKSFTQDNAQIGHLKTDEDEKTLKCPVCVKSLRVKSYLAIVKNYTADHNNDLTGEKKYKCHYCLKLFQSKSTLLNHMLIHKDKNQHTSSESVNDSIVKHVRVHTREKLFQCSVCKDLFSQRSHLDTHMEGHTKGKPLQCSECNKSFFSKSHLVRHVKLHTVQKPLLKKSFTCSVCNKSNATKSNLVQHMKVHTGEKSFQCTECMQCFSRSSCLDTHMRIHSGEKPFQCSKCNKSFTHRSSFKYHMKIREGKEPYICLQCHQSFQSSSCFKQHKRSPCNKLSCQETSQVTGASHSTTGTLHHSGEVKQEAEGATDTTINRTRGDPQLVNAAQTVIKTEPLDDIDIVKEEI